MKKLLVITLSGLMGLSAAAQGTGTQPDAQPENIAVPVGAAIQKTDLSKIYGSGTTGRSTGRPMITTEPNVVYGMGAGRSDAVAKFVLKKGHYIIGAEGSSRDESHSLFVNPSANDPDKYVALYIDNNVFTDEVGTAQIMIGAPTNNGNAIQFAPARIGLSGNIEDTSARSTNARVLLISKKLHVEDSKYPYMVRGLNGATNHTLMGMRGAESNLDLRVGATRNMFQWENDRKNKIVVDGNSLTEFKPGIGQQDYEMFNLNNEYGAFYALTKTVYNTRTTDSGSKTAVEKFVVFLSEAHVFQSSPNDCMLMATPVGIDQLSVQLYAPAERRGFFERLFGRKGRLDPKPSKWRGFHSDATTNYN